MHNVYILPEVGLVAEAVAEVVIEAVKIGVYVTRLNERCGLFSGGITPKDSEVLVASIHDISPPCRRKPGK